MARIQLLDQPLGLGPGQRGRRKGHVLEGFGQDAAQAHDHAGPELGITNQSGDQLPSARDLLRDQKLDRAILWASLSQQRLGRGVHRFAIGQAHHDETPLGLVGNAVSTEFEHYGKPNALGGFDGLRRAGGPALLGEANAKARKEFLGGGFGKGRRVGLRHGSAA